MNQNEFAAQQQLSQQKIIQEQHFNTIPEITTNSTAPTTTSDKTATIPEEPLTPSPFHKSAAENFIDSLLTKTTKVQVKSPTKSPFQSISPNSATSVFDKHSPKSQNSPSNGSSTL